MAEKKKSLLGRIGAFIGDVADRVAGAVIGVVGGAVTGFVQSVFAAGKWAAKHNLGELGLAIGIVGAVVGFFVGMPIAAVSALYGGYKGIAGGISGGMDAIGKIADTLGVNYQTTAPPQAARAHQAAQSASQPVAQAASHQEEAAHRKNSTVVLTQGLTGSLAKAANKQALTTQQAHFRSVVPGEKEARTQGSAVTVVPYGSSKKVEPEAKHQSSAADNVKEGQEERSQRRLR